MTSATEAVRAFWQAAEARDWAAFAALLDPDVVYETPQTRERVHGRPDVVRFNEEYPGGWHVTHVRAIGEGAQAVTWATVVFEGDELTALTFFELGAGGLITRVTDFWPEPYDPPPGREHLAERY